MEATAAAAATAGQPAEHSAVAVATGIAVPASARPPAAAAMAAEEVKEEAKDEEEAAEPAAIVPEATVSSAGGGDDDEGVAVQQDDGKGGKDGGRARAAKRQPHRANPEGEAPKRRARESAEADLAPPGELTVMALGGDFTLSQWSRGNHMVLTVADSGPRKVSASHVLFRCAVGVVRSHNTLLQDTPGWQPSSEPCLPLRVVSSSMVVLSLPGKPGAVTTLQNAWKVALREVEGVRMYSFITPSVDQLDPRLPEEEVKELKVTFTLKDSLYYLPVKKDGPDAWVAKLLPWLLGCKAAKLVPAWSVQQTPEGPVFGPFGGVALVTHKAVAFNKHNQVILP